MYPYSHIAMHCRIGGIGSSNIADGHIAAIRPLACPAPTASILAVVKAGRQAGLLAHACAASVVWQSRAMAIDIPDDGSDVPEDFIIAQRAVLKPLGEVAAQLGLQEDEFEFFGRTKAKVRTKSAVRVFGLEHRSDTFTHISANALMQ